jgi:hypothetical protein
MPRERNPCARTVKPENAYAVYQDASGEWTYYVLRKYQTEANAERNPYARYYCMVVSPACPRGEYGDSYRSTVLDGTHLIANPLIPSPEQAVKKTLIVQALTDEVREHFSVTDLTPRARKHKRYQIELPTECVHTISKERSIIGPIEFYDCLDGRVIVTTHAWNQLNASMKTQEAL